MSGDGLTRFGFHWGNLDVTRAVHVHGRGRVVHVAVDDKYRLEVYVSEGGKSVRVWKDGVEMKTAS